MPSSFSGTATIAAVLALGVSASSLPAHAGPTAAQLLSGYNLILTGNDSSQSDVEGNAVIGGNITKGHTFFNSRAPANPAVILYGSITGNQINLNSSGSLYAPTSQSGKVNYNGGGSYKGAPTQTLSTYTDPLSALSTSLSHLASTGSTLTVSGNTATFDAKPGVGGIAVFDLAASTLEDLSNVNVVFDQDAGTKGIIVNVSGIGATTFSISSSVNWNQAAQTDVLFNFFDATSTVTLKDWEASVLAPDATVGTRWRQSGGDAICEEFLRRRRAAQLHLSGGTPQHAGAGAGAVRGPRTGADRAWTGTCTLWRREIRANELGSRETLFQAEKSGCDNPLNLRRDVVAVPITPAEAMLPPARQAARA